MTDQKLIYINKLKKSIDEASDLLKGDISLQLIVKHARKELSVIGYLSEKEVKELKEKVRSIITEELEKMRKEFESL